MLRVKPLSGDATACAKLYAAWSLDCSHALDAVDHYAAASQICAATMHHKPCGYAACSTQQQESTCMLSMSHKCDRGLFTAGSSFSTPVWTAPLACGDMQGYSMKCQSVLETEG